MINAQNENGVEKVSFIHYAQDPLIKLINNTTTLFTALTTVFHAVITAFATIIHSYTLVFRYKFEFNCKY